MPISFIWPLTIITLIMQYRGGGCLEFKMYFLLIMFDGGLAISGVPLLVHYKKV